MKKLILSNLFIALLLLVGFSNPSLASENSVLEFNSITDELQRIINEYEMGEPLSEEDAAFVLEHGNKAPQQSEIRPMFSYSPNLSAQKTVDGLWVGVSATCEIDHWNPLENKYECTVYANSNKGTVIPYIEHVAWGVIGENLIGKVYERTFKGESGTRNAKLSDGDTYAGGVLVSTTTVRATAKYGSTTASAFDSY